MFQQDRFLRKAKVLRLGTLGSNGVHVVPVWYLYSSKKFYIGTNTKTKKARNIMHNKEVAFCIDEGINSPDIYGVMGQGRANLIVERPKVKRIAAKILLRYFDSIANPAAQQLLDETDCIIEIIPDRTTSWHY